MAIPDFTMRQLLEAGVHFGHHTRRWNPKMAPYIFGVRNGVHIIDLQQTMPMLYAALAAIREITAAGGRVLFVGTKRQASDLVADSAVRCGQYFINHRWLGGTLTNWKTITASIKRLRQLDEILADVESGLTKKELLGRTRERGKLQRALGGIKEMGGLPDILFVIDTNKEAIAIKEAAKLNIPVVGIIDSNSDPHGIAYTIPGNDDAIRSIALYCDLVSRAVLDGLQQEAIATGSDIGEGEDVLIEELPAEAGVPAEAEAPAEAEVPAVEATAAPAAEAGDAAPAAETDDAAPAAETDDAAPAAGEVASPPGESAAPAEGDQPAG